MSKKRYEFTEIEIVDLDDLALEEEEESSLLLRAYAVIPRSTDGGCGADGGSDGGPPYC